MQKDVPTIVSHGIKNPLAACQLMTERQRCFEARKDLRGSESPIEAIVRYRGPVGANDRDGGLTR
jgi:hypothetical protein